MKLLAKITFGLITFCGVTSASILSITSCSTTNPFLNYKTGDNIQINNGAEANFAKTVAMDKIAQWPQGKCPAIVDNTWAQDIAYKMINNTLNGSSHIDFYYPSAQVYWELVYHLAVSFTNTAESVNISSPTDGSRDEFLVLGAANNLRMKDSYTITVVGDETFGPTKTFNATQADTSCFKYGNKPVVSTGTSHYQFTITTQSTYAFNSFGLYELS